MLQDLWRILYICSRLHLKLAHILTPLIGSASGIKSIHLCILSALIQLVNACWHLCVFLHAFFHNCLLSA